MLTVLVAFALAQATLQPLTEAQVSEAIALGQKGSVPIVQVGRFSANDLDVFILGPMARIARAAAAATKQFRPFGRADVTPAMLEPVYTIEAVPTSFSRSGANHIVLQPKGAQGMDGVIQPLREMRGVASVFDHFPEGGFQVVAVTGTGPQRYTVSPKDRAKIR